MAFKVWIITGCSSGFGNELTLAALANGDKVIATARNVDKIANLKEAGANTLALDVTWSLDQLKKTAEQAHQLYGRIDYLVNNAGYIQVGGLEELTAEEVQAQFNTNVFGLLNVTRAILPYMRTQRSGVIANLSSVGAWEGYPGVGLYCASKWAVSGFSLTLGMELEEFGIKVCTIEPGYFRSNFLQAGNRLVGSNVISDYENSKVRQGLALMEKFNNNQPGDIKKGAKVMVDVLTQRTGKEIPDRLVLGSDAYGMIRGICENMIKNMDTWKDVTYSTDLDK